MVGREPGLNDPYHASLEGKPQVDREKIYKAWEELHRLRNVPIPPISDTNAVLEFTGRYTKKALELREKGEDSKAAAYIYFASLVLLRSSIQINDIDLITAHRAALRAIERFCDEGSLTPKVT